MIALSASVPRQLRLVAIVAAASFGLAACSSMMMKPMSSSTESFKATLSGTSEVPPNNSPATGELEAKLDKATGKLSWTITYSGLTGPAAMAHFHGPAPVGKNAGVVIAFQSPASPITGEATLTTTQITDLEAGLWYANVHTKVHPAGEIRGQVVAN